MDLLTSVLEALPGGDNFVVAKQTTGQWHVDAENPDDEVDMYERESRQEYANVSEYLPTSTKHSKQMGGLEAMMAQVRRFADACRRQRSLLPGCSRCLCSLAWHMPAGVGLAAPRSRRRRQG